MPSRAASPTAACSTRSRFSRARGSVTGSDWLMVRFGLPPFRLRTVYEYGVRTAYEPGWRRPRMPARNLAARAGRWSAQHRRTAILGWILFVVLAAVLGGKVGQNDVDESARGSGESKRGDMIVKAAGFADRAGEQVLVQGTGSVKA